MQKYYITNGNLYVVKRKGDITTTPKISLATGFDLKTARNILTNNLDSQMQLEYYILSEDEKSKIDIKPQSEMDIDVLLSTSELITELLDKINSIPSLEECLQRKTLLLSELSSVDLELADITHWMEKYSPNAGARCKVFKMQQEKLLKRRRIKQTLNYIAGLIKCYENDKNLESIKNELSVREYKEYIPRTNTWNELNNIYGVF